MWCAASAVALSVSSCSDNSAEDIVPEVPKTTVEVAAQMNVGGISAETRALASTRADYTPGTTSDITSGKINVAVYWNTTATDVTKKYVQSVSLTNNTANPTGLYWDDFGGYTADLDLVGVCVFDVDGKPAVPSSAITFPEASVLKDSRTISWTLVNTVGSQTYKPAEDLCVSGYISNLQHSTHAKGGEFPVGKFSQYTDNNSVNHSDEFRHVLSKITVSLTAGEGYTDGNFPSGNTAVTINGIKRAGTVKLEDRSVTATGSGVNISGNAVKAAGATTYDVSFLAMPNETYVATNVLTEFLSVTVPSPVSGQTNTYSVPTKIIASILKAAAGTDAEALGVGTDNQITLKSGVHYKINLIIKKQKITVVAQIKDWDEVKTDKLDAPIVFENDIKIGDTEATVVDEDRFKNGFQFYRSTNGSDYSVKPGNAYTYDSGTGEWYATGVFYWESSTQSYYFRALFPSATETNAGLEAAKSNSYATYKDLYWGTTAAYTWGTTAVDEGNPVHPRTGPVKMVFYPVLSQIQVNVVTTTGDDKVELLYLINESDKIKVTIKNTHKTGTIDLHNSISLSDTKADYQLNYGTNVAAATDPATSAKVIFGQQAGAGTTEDPYTYFDYVLPQSLVGSTPSEDAVIEIIVPTRSGTLTYSRALKDVKVTGSTDQYVTKWERGNKYVYTLTIKKSGIDIVAKLVDWVEKEGSVEVPFM